MDRMMTTGELISRVNAEAARLRPLGNLMPAPAELGQAEPEPNETREEFLTRRLGEVAGRFGHEEESGALLAEWRTLHKEEYNGE